MKIDNVKLVLVGEICKALIGVGPDASKMFRDNSNAMDRVRAACIVGCRNAQEAHQAYHENYEPGWQGFGGMRQLTMDDFKDWLSKGKCTRPI